MKLKFYGTRGSTPIITIRNTTTSFLNEERFPNAVLAREGMEIPI